MADPVATPALHLDDTVVDLDRLEVSKDGGVEPLTPLEASLLRYLAERRGQAVARDELLREVWSYADGVETQAVRACVRRVRQKLEHDPDTPRWLKTVRGVGWMLEGAARQRATPHGLPAQAGRFLGRQSDLAAVEDALAGVDPVVLVGPGGAGKTRLACELAQAWPGEVAFADLTGARDVGAGRATVARALGLPAEASSERIAAALAARSSCLVVLDNLESVLELFADTPTWLADAPDARVLATSQDRPGLAGEQVIELGALTEAAGVALFEDRAARADPDATAAVVAIVRLLDGLPLAIELVAARTQLLAADELEQRLRQRILPVARGRKLGGPARHQGLQAALDAAWDRLDDDGQRALAQLSVFRGRFSLPAAESLIDGERPALDRLQELRDRSLVQATDDASPWRLYLTRAVQEYAASRLDLLGFADEARARHAHVALAAARACVPGLVPEPIRQNLWAVHRRFADDHRGLWALVWLARPTATRRAALVAQAFDRIGDPVVDDPHLAAALLLARVQLHRQIGRTRGEVTAAQARAALTLCEESGNLALELEAIAHLARVCIDLGSYDDAVRALERGLDVAGHDHPTDYARARMLSFRSSALGLLGRHSEAIASAERAVALARHADPAGLWIDSRLVLATQLRQAGRLQRAHQLARAALDDTTPIHRARVGLQILLGTLSVDIGDAASALRLQRQALEEQTRWGETWPRRYLLPNMAISHLLLGDLERADDAMAGVPSASEGTAFHQGHVIIRALLDWGRKPDAVVVSALEALGPGDPTRVEHAQALAACMRALGGATPQPLELHDSTAAAVFELARACAAAARGDAEDAERVLAQVGHRAGSTGQLIERQIRLRLEAL